MALEDSDLWKTIKAAINDLVENKDLELQTREEYVIGYICRAIECQKKNSKLP